MYWIIGLMFIAIILICVVIIWLILASLPNEKDVMDQELESWISDIHETENTGDRNGTNRIKNSSEEQKRINPGDRGLW